MLLVNSVAGSGDGSEDEVTVALYARMQDAMLAPYRNAKRTLDNLQKKIEHRNVRPDGVNVDFSEKIMAFETDVRTRLDKLSKPVEDCHDKKFIEHVPAAVSELEIYLATVISLYLENCDANLVTYHTLDSFLKPFFKSEDSEIRAVMDGCRNCVATWRSISKQLPLHSAHFQPIAQRIGVIADALENFSEYINCKAVSTPADRWMLDIEQEAPRVCRMERRKRESLKNDTVHALDALRNQMNLDLPEAQTEAKV